MHPFFRSKISRSAHAEMRFQIRGWRLSLPHMPIQYAHLLSYITCAKFEQRISTACAKYRHRFVHFLRSLGGPATPRIPLKIRFFRCIRSVRAMGNTNIQSDLKNTTPTPQNRNAKFFGENLDFCGFCMGFPDFGGFWG